jgi:tRNA-dihydrouridine synthase B
MRVNGDTGFEDMKKDLSNILKKPLYVGNRQINTRLFLAPMAGIGHIAFRELVSTYGGYGLLFSEMCNAKALPHENRNTSPVFRWRDEEIDNLVCQIFGSDPHTMTQAAKRVEKEGFFGIDINFGCSVSAICKQGCGAALLKDPNLAVSIVSAVRKAVSIPVFVKFRTGWKDDPGPAVEIAKRFEDAGADALCFHPRVAPDRRTRPPKWEYIGMVKQAVSVPVFGNGNVFDSEDCLKMIETTGCDGVSIGRIAIASPWVFKVWSEGFAPGPDIYKACAINMARLLEKHYDPYRAFKLFKKFAIYFSANFVFGHSVYNKLCKADDMSGIKENIYKIFEKTPEVASRPNMNMFVS